MTYKRKKETKPTCTTLVLNKLAELDDFMTVDQISVAIVRTKGNVSAALCWLRSRKAVDSVESAGRLWWMATPDTDTRVRVLNEITVEQIHKTRRKRVIKSAT